MAMQRYKISLLVLKNVSQVSAMIEWNTFQHFIIQTTMKYPTISFQHIFVDFLETSGTKVWLIYETIAKVILSQVKITCYFHKWRYNSFMRKFTWDQDHLFALGFMDSVGLVKCWLKKNWFLAMTLFFSRYLKPQRVIVDFALKEKVSFFHQVDKRPAMRT